MKRIIKLENTSEKVIKTESKENVIESISVNGERVNPVNKNVNINVPTKTSQLENDSGYTEEESDPTVPEWAKQPEKPSYTATEVGADKAGSANASLFEAKKYTDNKISALINGAPETLDTIYELAEAVLENEEILEVLNEAIRNKLGKDENASSATKLETARKISISNGATGTATSFDGTQDVSIPITSLNTMYLRKNGDDVLILNGNF